jgi:hypothetical protein
MCDLLTEARTRRGDLTGAATSAPPVGQLAEVGSQAHSRTMVSAHHGCGANAEKHAWVCGAVLSAMIWAACDPRDGPSPPRLWTDPAGLGPLPLFLGTHGMI